MGTKPAGNYVPAVNLQGCIHLCHVYIWTNIYLIYIAIPRWHPNKKWQTRRSPNGFRRFFPASVLRTPGEVDGVKSEFFPLFHNGFLVKMGWWLNIFIWSQVNYSSYFFLVQVHNLGVIYSDEDDGVMVEQVPPPPISDAPPKVYQLENGWLEGLS